MTDMATVLLISFGILAISVLFRHREQAKLLSENKIIKRDNAFYEAAEDFEVAAGKAGLITEELIAIGYNEMDVAMKGNGKEQQFLFTSPHWIAQLVRTQAGSDTCTYRFSFNSWRARRGAAVGTMQMNMLLTAIEKAFLRIDPGAKVTSTPLQTKTEVSLF